MRDFDSVDWFFMLLITFCIVAFIVLIAAYPQSSGVTIRIKL